MAKYTSVIAGLVMTGLILFSAVPSAYADNCGNGSIQPGEVCDNNGANATQDVGCCAAGCASFVTGGTACRATAGVCDTVAETCTGSTGTCPADQLSPTTVVCRPSNGAICDVAENCTGTSAACPDPVFADASTVCRSAVGICDAVENCTGASLTCPGDSKSNAVCRPDSGACDPGAETCDGTSNNCPADSFSPSGTVCRTSEGACDLEETCTGAASTCPSDLHKSSVCRVSVGECDLAESCNGTNDDCPADGKSTAVCRPGVNELCDVAESCDGTNNACPDDELVNCADNDEVACTEATCDPNEGCVIVDNCVEICRGPGFWQTHSGYERGINIGQAVLDAGGPLLVCGEEINNTTDLGSLQSSLEGLCIRTQGVQDRKLYRQLVTTAFNCAISEGGDCDNVLEGLVDVKFSECSALCADNPVEGGPSFQDCVEQLGCFNGGGQWKDGQCAKGTCEGNPGQFCGGDFDECADEADCVRFADSCASVDLCSDDLEAPAQICPKPGPASSPKICNVARHNDCTIDSCPGADSCEGICGGQAPGGCYCDFDSCGFGDGCADRDQFCNICN